MINIRLIYEQIEACKAHLLSGSLLGFRMALILSDNVAELLMYQELDRQFAFDDQLLPKWEPTRTEWLRAGRGPKYTPEERLDAEREFKPKTRILRFRLGRISNDDSSILNVCHKFRCEAFHRGKLRSSILEQVSKLLYISVVNLTLKLPISTVVLPSPNPGPADASFLSRFGIQDAMLLVTDSGKQQLADKLLADVDFNEILFAKILSSNIIDRIDETIGYLEYIGETNDHSQIDRNIQYHQFWREVGAKLMEEGIRQPNLEEAFLIWQSQGKAKYTFRKIEKWKQKAELIALCKIPARVLEQYWSIDKHFRPFEDEIAEAVFRYDEEINSRI